MAAIETRFLQIPQEVREVIYAYTLYQASKPLAVEYLQLRQGWHRSGWRRKRVHEYGRHEQPKAFLQHASHEGNVLPTLFSTIAIAQVNRQIRSEFSDFLHLTSTKIDIVAEVRNFDFGIVIRAIPPQKVLNLQLMIDGTAVCILKLALGGPYDANWRTNLERWIDYLESSMMGSEEVGTQHRTVLDLSTADP